MSQGTVQGECPPGAPSFGLKTSETDAVAALHYGFRYLGGTNANAAGRPCRRSTSNLSPMVNWFQVPRTSGVRDRAPTDSHPQRFEKRSGRFARGFFHCVSPHKRRECGKRDL